VAGGLIAPEAVRAANLNTNLIVNSTFESVDFGVTGDYGAPRINSWAGNGFAYSHQPGVTGVPDYAEGADPPAAGNWYFTANNQPGAATEDVRTPNVVFQDVDVSTGATGTQIASGEAAFRLGAYMTSYLNDSDAGNVHVQFKTAGGTTIGTAELTDVDAGPGNVWSFNAGAAFIPVGTASLRVSLFGTPVNGGADGFIDNIDMQVTNAANELLYAHVNTTNGQVAIKNQTGQPVHIDFYQITSGNGALNKTAWSNGGSLQDTHPNDFPAGDGSGNGWEEIGNASDNVIGESFLTGHSSVNNGATIPIGAAYSVGEAHDLVFKYSVISESPRDADFDGDGDVDGADLIIWSRNLGRTSGATKAQGNADGDADVDAADLAILSSEFGTTSFDGPGLLVTGFIRYSPSGPATGVPEPSSCLLVCAGLAAAGHQRRRPDDLT
jgi:hypothetical protein